MENLNGVRAALGVSNALVPLNAVAEGLILGFVLLGAFISALDGG